jgi:hypothetical protein
MAKHTVAQILKFQKNTDEKLAYYKKRNFKVIEMWECSFKCLKRRSKPLRDLCEEYEPDFSRSSHKGPMSESTILDSVRRDEFFGMLEVDLAIPASWDKDITPEEYFAKISPLFMTTEVNYEEFGEHMQNHVETEGLSKKSRKVLVSGLRGEKMLLISPLLKWYLEKGLVVSKIHQVVEFSRARPFTGFTSFVTEARRAGDTDPDKTIIADLATLLGNSTFGSLIMNVLKHTDCKYVNSCAERCAMVNNPRFRGLTELSDNIYEVKMGKERLNLRMPTYLGFFVLQYSK